MFNKYRTKKFKICTFAVIKITLYLLLLVDVKTDRQHIKADFICKENRIKLRQTFNNNGNNKQSN